MLPKSLLIKTVLCFVGIACVLPGSAVSQQAGDTVTTLHDGARVRAMVPSFGSEWQTGLIAMTDMPEGRCIGVLLDSEQLVVTLQSIESIEVSSLFDGRQLAGGGQALYTPGADLTDEAWRPVALVEIRNEDPCGG